MHVNKRLMLFVAVFVLALPLIFTGTASARFVGDGAVQDGVTGGWKAPTDGICVLSIAPDGTMVVDSSITNNRDCQARLINVTAVTPNDTLANVCGTPAKNTDNVKYAAPGSSTCVTIDGSGNIVSAISMKDNDRNAVMCAELGGQLANATLTTLTNGTVISTATSTVANGTAAKCIAYTWALRGQDASGAPLSFGSKGTPTGTSGGYCYTAMITGITPTTSCPSALTDVRAKFGYSVSGSNCIYAYGLNGPISAAKTAIDGTVTAAGTVVDLTTKTMGECLAGAYSWDNWMPKDGTTTTPNGAVVATYDYNKRSNSSRDGCLKCHSTVVQTNGPAERWKDSYLLTGHKNMLRKVTAGMNWAGPDADGILQIYTAAATGSINFTNATAQISGVDKPLLYLFGDWMAPAPGGLDVIVDMSGSAKYNGTSNYSCAPCHTTGWSNVSAGLCSLSSKTNQTDCTNAGGTWVQSSGSQGLAAQEPAASFPGITFTGAGTWDLDGITCTRCHGTVSPAPAATASMEVQPSGHANNTYSNSPAANNLCYGCHQSPAKTVNGTGADVDTAHPENLPVKMVSTASGTVGEFNGHVLGNAFLNSPHAQFSGTISPNVVGKWNIAGGTYASTFAGLACFQGASSSSPALTKGDGTFIDNKAECEALYGAGAWKNPTTTGGNCTTCHDVHNSLFVAGQTHHPLRRECETCHEDTAGNGYAAANVPQLAGVGHPGGTNTPYDTAKFANPCEACHMPKATDGGFPMHLWRINTSASYTTFPTEAQFNAGQKIAYSSPDGSYTNAVWVDLDLACGQCHNANGLNYEAGIPTFTKDQLAAAANALHSDTSNNADCLTCHSTAQGTKRAINQGVDHHLGNCITCHAPGDGGTSHYKSAWATAGVAAPNIDATTASLQSRETPTFYYWGINTSLRTACLGCHANPVTRESDGATLGAIIPSGTTDNHHSGHSSVPGTSFGGVAEIIPGSPTNAGSRGANDPGMNCLGCHGKASITGGSSSTGYTMKFAASGLSTSTVAAQNNRVNTNGLCMGCHEVEQGLLHHNGDCNECHHYDGTWSGTYPAGVGSGVNVLYTLTSTTDRTVVMTYCQGCHASAQAKAAGGTTMAIVPSGTGDNHHRGSNAGTSSSTGVVRSLGGCLYCHGEMGGVAFGGVDTEAAQDQVVGTASPCQDCHAVIQSNPTWTTSPQDHHDGSCTTCHHTDGTYSGTYPAGVTDAGTLAALASAASMTTPGNTNAACLNCHKNNVTSVASGATLTAIVPNFGPGKNHHGAVPGETDCIECHGEAGGLSASFGGNPYTNYNMCLSCHQNYPYTNALVPGVSHHYDITGQSNCTTCHNTSTPLDGSKVTGPGVIPVVTTCEGCHIAGQHGWSGIINHEESSLGNPRTARCQKCHDSSGVVSGVTYTNNAGITPTGDALIQVACGQCHGGSETSTTTNSAPYKTLAQLNERAAVIHAAAATASFVWTNSASTDYAVDFNASGSTCPSGATCTYSWSTGESGVTASHTFANSTPQTVTLTVTASTGGSATASQSVTPRYVGANPTSLSMSTSVSGYTVSGTYSVSGGVAPYTVTGKWGDGTVSALSGGTFSHTYVSAGTYTVNVTAIDSGDNGNNKTSSSVSQSVTITSPTISGKVTRLDGTTPLSGALVLIKGPVSFVQITKADGTYTQGSLKPGTYTVTVTKSGYTFPTSPMSGVAPGSVVNFSSSL